MMEALLADTEACTAARIARPDDDPAQTLARISWGVIAEPGDGVAGALIAQLGAVEALRVAVEDSRFALSDRVIGEAQRRWRPRARPRAVMESLRGAQEVGARLMLSGDEQWPESLDDLGDHAPALLWVRGDAGRLVAPERVSIVGARAASAYGESIAAEFAGDLAASGTLVVSGGAYGIDGAAHRAALGVGGGTVAFLAGGVDRAYPAGHQQLFERIQTTGAMVSELPCGAAPTKWRFLARNRLIAALGMATVVVEAGWRSGSLNTAGHAAALGRPLGAVPGPVTSAASAGCHRLLREYDARCVTSTADVRELLGMDASIGGGGGGGAERVDPDQIRLLDAMSTRTARSSTELARIAGLSEARVRALLGLLSLERRVGDDGAGWRLRTR
ncbi:DNA-processing protein DprA [Microbacterium sp. AK031]|uniref:DNA-processing protein DprA n=1 Tax=Microbacterium sp. AK031 TaxID=2723076 RepID=UPI0021688F34|nr:DNA-processing protein DprA [Microbacterium sp. AK031]MCS3842709.1 DNA processing protein [Microbacterium sp. AK031]